MAEWEILSSTEVINKELMFPDSKRYFGFSCLKKLQNTKLLKGSIAPLSTSEPSHDQVLFPATP
jgi:hypothetical protein